MKNVIALILSLAVSVSAMAANNTENIDKLSSLSIELGQLKSQLKEVKEAKNVAIIKTVVSFTAATALGIVAKKVANSGGGDITQMANLGFGMMIGVSAVVPVGYGAYQGYQITVKTEEINKLINVISQKELEIEAAKRVLEQLN